MRRLDRVGDPLRLGPRGPCRRAELPELLGDRGEARVGLVQPRERDVRATLGLLTLALEPRDVERQPLARGGGLRPYLGLAAPAQHVRARG